MKKQAVSTLSQLEARAADAQALIQSENNRLSDLHNERDSAIRRGAPDEELDQLGDAIDAANRIINREAAKVSVLAIEIDEERKRVADEEQREREKTADAAAERAARAMRDLFALFRENVRATLRAAAEADLLVETANKHRRASPPLPSVEARCRPVPSATDKIIHEERVKLWAFASTGACLSEADQSRVHSRDNATGILPNDSMMFTVGGNNAVVRREFIRRTVQLGSRGGEPDALASVLTIPGLQQGDAPIWEPISFPSPETILAALQTLERSHPSGAVKTELIPVETATDEEVAA